MAKLHYAKITTNTSFVGAYVLNQNTAYAPIFNSFLNKIQDNSIIMCHPGYSDKILQQREPNAINHTMELNYFLSQAYLDTLSHLNLSLR